MKEHTNLKNLIFDLGGVILNLSFQKTFDAFSSLVNIDPNEIAKSYYERPEFNAFEKGELSEAEFRSWLRRLFVTSASDAELDACWNAMLVDIPIERIRLLENLRTRYQLFLLSNTNSIHEKHFNRMVSHCTPHCGLEPLFDKTYYSHQIGMRKPDLEIYGHVLEDNKIQAQETLFLDDNLGNLNAAKQLGINTYHVQKPDLILELFD